MATVEEARAAEFRRKMTARARWACTQALRAFPGDPARAAAVKAGWKPVTNKHPGWEPSIDCGEDKRGLQIP